MTQSLHPSSVQASYPDEEVFVFPVSFAQRRLWFLDQLQPDSPFYNIAAAVQLEGTLHVAALERSLQTIVDRHEALRTTFARIDWQPMQIVHPTLKLHVELIDLTLHPAEQRDQLAQELAIAEARQPFSLSKGPLIRAKLLRLGELRHILLLTMHHIVSDGWSISIFVHELAALYNAFLHDQPSPLPDLPIQYADFTIWQQQQLQGEVLERQLAYWRSQLAGISPTLNLPTDRPHPAVQTFHGAQHALRLDPALTAALKALSQQENVTLFMTLLAAFQVLLHRYSNQDDIAIGSPTANRNTPSTEPLIGFFVNMLVLRSNLAGNPSFRELLAQVREVAIGAYAHQDLPFERLVDELQPERDLSRNPLFQVMFALQNIAMPALELPGLTLNALPVDSGTAQFELTLNLEERDGVLSGWFEYNSDLFDATSIAQMSAQFQTLLAGIVADPSQRIWALPLLPVAERQQLLAEWNATTTPYPQEQTIHEQIAAQAARSPAAIALIFEQQRLSYQELDQRSNQLAHYLQRHGVGPDVLVGIALPRSLELMVALLAILKAGGAYLPLDPSYPAERLAFMLQDAGVRVLIASDPDQPLAGEYQLIHLLHDWPVIAQEARTAPESAVTSSNLAYVIYTSGSTGTPKGVMIEHRQVINFFTGMDARLGRDTPGVWLATTSISFDISVLELFWTLARGYTVVIQHEQADNLFSSADDPAVSTQPIDFSLFYFASDDQQTSAAERYRLLFDGATFADEHGFAAVWSPERHFHAFGGLYPNPSVTSAALAARTRNVQIRAGSVVLPLHNPIRVAEEWALVDNFSQGRVGISFASGWHADDFVFAPEHYRERKEVMLQGIETVRRLWRGEALTVPGGAGNPVDVRILPRPIQPELPVWITAAGNPETFRSAGAIGANLLTHLLGQNITELAEKITAYREAWQAHGHPGRGHVTLMLHTFVEQDIDFVRDKVRQPFTNYLRSSVDLMRNLARSLGQDLQQISDTDLNSLLDHAFERYFATSGLFGTPQSCLALVNQLKGIGVDEIACLIDFGVEVDAVLSSLESLDQLRQLSNRKQVATDFSLAGQIRQHAVTHLQCTPSLARMLAADAKTLNALADLEVLLLGGEALPATLAQQLRTQLPAQIHNMYGPTETTIWSATHPVDGVTGSTVSIGTPIANTTIYILDQQLQPTPIGVPGELYIGGAGVARGYLKRPDLSAARFVPDPFVQASTAPNGAAKHSGRLYKTGDLARWRSDGTLEFLGRVDHQVKLGGHRIEPGEIEAVLLQHSAVREAVVMVRTDPGSAPRLLAYVVPAQPSAAGEHATASLAAELRQFLRERLPDYMVPAAFISLAALPLTPNGKLNRRALPAPNDQPQTTESSYVAPQSELERSIADVWQEVLQLQRVGVNDNFFEVGGNSLLVVQVHSKLSARLGRELAMADLFRHPTINALAQFLSGSAESQQSQQQIHDRAKRQTQARQLDAVSRQRQFMEERRKKA